MASRYRDVEDGEVVHPNMDGYSVACCDCGLVHRFVFAVTADGKSVMFRAFRDNRKTAARRREMKKRGEQGAHR